MSVAMEKNSTSLHDVLCKYEWTLEDIEFCLEKDSSSANQKYSDNETSLHLVLRDKNCSLEVVQLLLKYGPDVHCKDAYGRTPLLVALSYSREDAIVMALIKKGADVRALDGEGRSSLCIALRHKASKNVIETLLRKGCRLAECNHRCHGRSVLHCSLDDYDDSPVLSPDVFNLLIERGADVNAIDSKGCSVVCCALQMGRETRFIKMLLEAGGLLNGGPKHAPGIPVCIEHDSPFNCATAVFGRPFEADLVELLFKLGAPSDKVDDQGLIPLQRALQSTDYETQSIVLLLDRHKGMNLDSLVDNYNNSLLHLTVSNNYCKLSAVKLLVQRGVKVDARNRSLITPLNVVVERDRSPSVIKFLLKNGAKVQADTLGCAMKHPPNVEILKLLWVASDSISAPSYLNIIKEKGSILDNLNLGLAGFNSGYSQFVGPLLLSCIQFLVRVYLLHISDYSMKFLKHDPYFYKDFVNYRDQCVLELLRMKSKDVGRGHTLHDFLRVCSSPYDQAANREKMYDFDRLLEAIGNDAFPLYFDMIAYKVGKRAMKEYLKNVRMSVPNPTNALAEIVLPYEVMLKITKYLGKEDLLSLILVFSNVQGSGK